ncbi:hypothetical protein [Bradyrhizobium sp. USDA 3315]
MRDAPHACVENDLNQSKERKRMFAYEFCGCHRELVMASAFADGFPEYGELVGVGRPKSGLESRYEFEPVHRSAPPQAIVSAGPSKITSVFEAAAYP